MKTRYLPTRVFLILNLVGWIFLATVCTVQAAPPQQSGVRYHIVTRGQTLSGIAAQHGTTIGAIVRANKIRDPNRIYVGQRLAIHTSAAPASVSAPRPAGSGSCTHQIVWGDTLSRIAARYGTTVGQLMAANGLSSTRIIAGRTLRVCGSSPVTPVRPPESQVSKSPPSGITNHHVRAGNTLSGIALLYNTTVQAIMTENRLKNPNHIYIGQSLRIPRP